MSVNVEVAVGGPAVGVHGLQAGGDALLRSAGETPLAGLDQLAVGELQGQPGVGLLRQLVTFGLQLSEG